MKQEDFDSFKEQNSHAVHLSNQHEKMTPREIADKIYLEEYGDYTPTIPLRERIEQALIQYGKECEKTAREKALREAAELVHINNVNNVGTDEIEILYLLGSEATTTSETSLDKKEEAK